MYLGTPEMPRPGQALSGSYIYCLVTTLAAVGQRGPYVWVLDLVCVQDSDHLPLLQRMILLFVSKGLPLPPGLPCPG